MGTGVGSRAVAECTKDKSVRVDGVILDSPMHSVTYALKMSPNFYHYSSFIIDWQRFMEIAGMEFNVAKVCFVNGLKLILKSSINYQWNASIYFFVHIFSFFQWVTKIECPVTIFHAEVDHVAPISGSEQIVEDAKMSGKSNIKLIRFKEEGLGHIGISKHPEFPKVIKNAVVEAHKHY